MNLHEYQSKELLDCYGLPVLPGRLAYTPGEVEAAADFLGGDLWVIKAQVHAGGRGKGGGVKLAKSAAEAREAGEAILGMTLVTPQTGPQGKLVRKVYVECGCAIKKEYYLSMLVDRSKRSVAVIASSEGGMDIEEVAEKHPDKIITKAIDPKAGYSQFYGVSIAMRLGLTAQQARKFSDVVEKLYDAFLDNDLSLVEINPLVLTNDDEFILLDAKCSADDNALFRHEHIRGFAD